jgi:hypothetical protein
MASLTGWAATMMGLEEAARPSAGRLSTSLSSTLWLGLMGECMPLFRGQGATYRHTGNRAPSF